jgi:hypothetical protein
MFNSMTDDMLREAAPSIFATVAAPSVSERYAYLPSYRVVRELRSLGFEAVSAREGKKRQPDGRQYAMHEVRFRRISDYAQAPELGELSPELLFLNSHDRTSGLSFDSGLHRAVCTNGMRVFDSQLVDMSFKVRHTGKDRVEQLHTGMQMLMKNLNRTIEIAQDWSKIKLNGLQATRFASAALMARGTALDVHPDALLIARREGDYELNLWNTFNRVQENITKGGASGRTSTGKRASLKRISTLAADVDFNRKLWAAASSLAAEARPASVPVLA